MRSATLWVRLSFAMSAVQAILREFPGLAWEAFFVCPDHRESDIKVSRKAHRDGDALLDESRSCHRCKLHNGGVGAVALELLEAVDVTRSPDELLLVKEERFARLRQRHGMFLDTDKLDHTMREERRMQLLEGIYAERVPIPRLACILPPWEFKQREGLSVEERSPLGPLGWMERLRKWEDNDFREGKGWLQKEKRLFFICGQTYHLAPCGSDGHGYPLRAPRTWAKKTIGVVSIMLEVISTTLGVMAAASLPTSLLEEVAGSGMDMGREQFTSLAKSQLERFSTMAGSAAVEQWQDVSSGLGVRELRRGTYKALQEFVYEAEDKADKDIAEAKRRVEKGQQTASSIPRFFFFDDVMKQIHVFGSGVPRVLWVLDDQAGAGRGAGRP